MANESWDMVSFDLGTIAIVARENRLIRICFECSQGVAEKSVVALYPSSKQSSQPQILEGLTQLTEYFLAKRCTFTLDLNYGSLTPFVRRVHQELVKIPYGEVVSYGELAARAGSPKAARAVGRVMSTNPFPLVVPCHRVVNADGFIGQYSAVQGTETKAWLIDFEQGQIR